VRDRDTGQAGTGRRRGRVRRSLLFLLISTLLHVGAAAAALLLLRDLWTPALQITWLDLDNRLGAPQPGDPKPAAKKTGAKPAPKTDPAPRLKLHPSAQAGEHAPRVPRRKAPDAGPSAENSSGKGGSGVLGADKIVLTDLAPGDAALMLLLRMDRIRRSPYEASVRRLLEVFYDHKTILWGSGLDPISDFDALLIATPNPYRVTETFLAVRSSRPVEELRRGFERATTFGSKRVRWSAAGGGALRGDIPSPPKLASDPRVIYLQRDLGVLTDPKLVGQLGVAGPSSSDAGVPGPSWLARLGLMGGRGGTVGNTGPGLLLQIVNLARLVALPAELPVPQNAQIGIEAHDPARVEAVLSFASESAAKAFVVEVKKKIEKVRQSDDAASRVLRWMGVADLLAAIRWQRKVGVVTATTSLGEKDVKAILEMFRGAIPQVQVPGMPDRRSLDAGPPRRRPDARAPDAGSGPHDARVLH
jgi:hypothetical protein